MASRIFHDLLLQSHRDLQRNERRTYWIVVALLLVHLAVIIPFADAGRRKAEAAADLQRLAPVGPALKAMEERLAEARETSMAALRPAVDEWVGGLQSDLQRLEASRWQWQQDASKDFEGTEGDTEDSPTIDESLQMTPPPRGVVPLTIPEAQRLQLSQAPNRYALLSLLEPIVESQIVGPRRLALEQVWKSEALPPLVQAIDTTAAEVSRLRGRFPEAESTWDALSAALSELARQADSWQVQLPSMAFWWASAESEPRLKLQLGAAAETLKRPPNLAQVAATQQQVNDRIAAVHTEWERRRAEVPDLDRNTAGVLGLDLDGFVPLFPLALGLLLAACMWRRGQVVWKVAVGVRMAIEHGSPRRLAPWLGGRLKGGKPAEVSADRLSSGVPWTHFLLLFGALAWIGAAGFQIYGPPTHDWAPWTPAALGTALVVIAALRCARINSQVVRLLNTAEDTRVTSSSALEARSEVSTAESDLEDPIEPTLRR